MNFERLSCSRATSVDVNEEVRFGGLPGLALNKQPNRDVYSEIPNIKRYYDDMLASCLFDSVTDIAIVHHILNKCDSDAVDFYCHSHFVSRLAFVKMLHVNSFTNRF